MSRYGRDTQVGVQTIDSLLSLVSSEYNRDVVRYFRDSSENVTSLEDLAHYVRSQQDEGTPSSSDRVATRLHHVNLPQLADSGLVEYDWEQNVVTYRENRLADSRFELVSEMIEEA